MEFKKHNILSISGGGIRGYMEALFMQLFCKEFKINEEKFIDLFDVVGGTSIGGIIAIALAKGITPSQLVKLFKNKRHDIFPSRAGWLDKLKFVTAGTAFYKRDGLVNAIKELIGEEAKIRDLKKRVIITTLKKEEDAEGVTVSSPVYITNMIEVDKHLHCLDFTLLDAACATSAAPMYFDPYVRDESTGDKAFYIDGGVWRNNPISACINGIRKEFPESNVQNILSLGTGVINFDFHGGEPPDPEQLKESNLKIFDGAQMLIYTLQASLGCAEAAAAHDAKMFQHCSNDNAVVYEYFQPRLNDYKDTELDNTSDEFFEYMEKKVYNEFYQKVDKYRKLYNSLILGARL